MERDPEVAAWIVAQRRAHFYRGENQPKEIVVSAEFHKRLVEHVKAQGIDWTCFTPGAEIKFHGIPVVAEKEPCAVA